MKDLFDREVMSPAECEAADRHKVMLAMALLWSTHTRSVLYDLLRKLEFKQCNGRFFTQDDLKLVLHQLREEKLIVESGQRQGYFCLADAHRSNLYGELLETIDTADLEDALFNVLRFNRYQTQYYWPIHDRDATIAIVRLLLLSGTTAVEVEKVVRMIREVMDWGSILVNALLLDFDQALFDRVDAGLRFDIAYWAVQGICLDWNENLLPVAQWALQQLGLKRQQVPGYLRIALAELLLHMGQREQALAAVEGMQEGATEALQAYALAQEGKWPEAQSLFENAIKLRQLEVGAKKRVLPVSIAWVYPLILLAQQSPAHLERARKFCVGESGKRDPGIHAGWGQWVHAIDIRRGDAAPMLTDAYAIYGQQAGFDQVWRVLLAAWVGMDAQRGMKDATRKALVATANFQVEHLRACGLDWLAETTGEAIKILNGQEPRAGYFVAGKAEHWREVLFALQSLVGAVQEKPQAGENSRFVWMITISKHGELQAIQPFEQKRGARGWSRPKEIALAKISGNNQLSPWDAKVANCIRTEKYGRRNATLELSSAIQALLGHPAVVLADNPEQMIELLEGTPEIEVIHKGDKISLKVTPPLRESMQETDHYYYNADEKREAEALRLITLVRDSAQRVRVIRFSPSQKRAAQLLAEKITIPAAAQQEVSAAMQALSAHFQLQADHLLTAREVPAEAKLRAELSPLDDGLLLRLVSTPLGTAGPRLVPGTGRARLMAMVGGESIGTSRDLKTERKQLEEVLDALPFLESCDGNVEQCEWAVADPEEALALVEQLPQLPAISALDWPKGRAVRVISVDMPQLALQVKSERDWFRVEGEARVDEGMVFTFETLLAASRSSSRFIAMGNGIYVALTRRLKERLSDLASVTDSDKHGQRIPRLAAAWIGDTLDGISTQADKEFLNSIAKLHEAQEMAIPLPGNLQAELRPYQEDGYLWASRLAQAGFGACLADDMGLGKTLQSLALLLARAERGPALIVAPTSVCGNWMAEAARFAPSLNFHLYSEADRENIIQSAGDNDVLVISYTMLQQAGEPIAAKHWHTVIADEAQAIKNASTKRSQAVFELNADFRLALSGTPVENRLAELWSIMRFANPGLLGSLNRFNERFAMPIERDKDRNAQHTLRRLIAPFLLRRTKTQVLQELPPRTELLLKVAVSKEEASHYEALRREAIAEADAAITSNKGGQARMNILAQLTRLRRAACDPRIVTPAFPGEGAKVQTFISLAAELVANGHKALVFSQFVDFLGLLRDSLDKAGIAYQYLDGATPAAERTKRVAAFQSGKSELFLISLKAGGFGLNLTAADYVVITDPWWNPAAEDQAMGRAHRMGQTRAVTVYRLVTQGTVEEQIVGLHNDKRALAESILGEGDAVSLPTNAELISLIKGD